jgi:hypothetical protein
MSWRASQIPTPKIVLDLGADFSFSTFVWAVDLDNNGDGAGLLTNKTGNLNPNGGNGGAGDIYIPPSLWTNSTQSIACAPPCTFVLPPYPLSTPTVITWPPYVTSVASSSGGKTYTKTTTIPIPVVTVTAITWWAITAVPNDPAMSIFSPEQSIMPPSLVLTLPATEATFPLTSTDYTSLWASPARTHGTVQTPQPYPGNSPTNCAKFWYVQSGDGCQSIATKNGISVAQFIAWNPAVGSGCTTLWLQEYYCENPNSLCPQSANKRMKVSASNQVVVLLVQQSSLLCSYPLHMLLRFNQCPHSAALDLQDHHHRSPTTVRVREAMAAAKVAAAPIIVSYLAAAVAVDFLVVMEGADFLAVVEAAA